MGQRMQALIFSFKEFIMAKGNSGPKGGGHPAPRGGKGGVGFIPQRPGGNKPSTAEKPSGNSRGNLPPHKGD
jgi:hypothetical protein